MRLLIVDDEEIIRRGLLMIDWAQAGITQVLDAADGVQAKELLQRQNIDVVVSDIKMPGLSGLELAEYVSSHTRHTRMILLTGFSDFSFARQAIRCGVVDYLLKPAKPKELLEVVRQACQSLQIEMEADRIVQDFHEGGSALSLQQQILHGFRGIGENVASILNYLAEHHAENITLSALSEEYHFSTIHISRMIKKETGYSFVDILTGIRLTSAARMLREEGCKINQICERVGFHDQRYFSQVFKRVFGCTPVEYRRDDGDPKVYTLPELLREMNQTK